MIAGLDVVVALEHGLHARPGARFVQAAAGFEAEVTVYANGRSAPARGLLSLMSLGIKNGTAVRLQGVGPDAELAVTVLGRLLRGEKNEKDD